MGLALKDISLICDSKLLQIHHNIPEALPYLACRSSTLPQWIDAVGINQSDDRQKIEKIRLTTEIYRRAARVWAWKCKGKSTDMYELVGEAYVRGVMHAW